MRSSTFDGLLRSGTVDGSARSRAIRVCVDFAEPCSPPKIRIGQGTPGRRRREKPCDEQPPAVLCPLSDPEVQERSQGVQVAVLLWLRQRQHPAGPAEPDRRRLRDEPSLPGDRDRPPMLICEVQIDRPVCRGNTQVNLDLGPVEHRLRLEEREGVRDRLPVRCAARLLEIQLPGPPLTRGTRRAMSRCARRHRRTRTPCRRGRETARRRPPRRSRRLRSPRTSGSLASS